ncbi:hypothetical protein NM688_g9449 [Phlebia brevispora]|uniref:Uncharacterized protein n=1 Tax=Phlebia brevispora TaxID=194682 RepID=A0ACC1RFN8_9APHY|nr:hypothetical protein NM688_g9449 [Phlebia brevispora]
MSHAKDKHYWAQLRATITAGNWDASFPGKAPNGSPLSWSELLRKFNKHCGGFADVAELVSQTQALSLLLAAKQKDQHPDRDEDRRPNDLALEDESILPEERTQEGSEGYAVLKGLNSNKSDPVVVALAYYAYALGRPSECLELLASVKDLGDVQARMAAYGTMRSDPLTIQVPVTGADSSYSRTGSLTSVATTLTETDVNDGRAWAATECVRSICLRGMSHEKLHPNEPQKALAAYQEALPLMDIIASERVSPRAPSHGTANYGDG